MSTGIDTKANTSGGGALERGHGALLETLAQLILMPTPTPDNLQWEGDCVNVADTKASSWEPVRATGGLLELLQCRAALQPVSESDSSLGVELVALKTASRGAEAGAEACQWALTRKQTLRGRRRTLDK